MRVLLSIKPEYVEKILDGSKKYEFRKNMFKRREVKTVVIYSTMPVGKVVGEFDIEKVINDEPQKVWDKTSKYAGISQDYFDEYFSGRQVAIAIKVGDVTKYDEPLCIKAFGDDMVAPQSYRYLAV